MVEEKAEKSGKKRRIIHWNPEGDAGELFVPEEKSKPWKGDAIIIIGLFLLFAATVAGLRLGGVLGPRENGEKGGSAESGDNLAGMQKPIFVSRETVERRRAEVREAISEIRKTTDDHPTLIQNLVRIESTFEEGNQLLASAAFPKALAKFEAVGAIVKEMKKFIADKKKATDVYEKFLVLIEKNEKVRSFGAFEYEQAVNFGNNGTNYLEQGNFAGAALDFTRAVNALHKLEGIVDKYVAGKELDGKMALSRGDKKAAKAIFTEVLDLQPEDELALRNLKRAENIDILVPLLKKAKALEKSGKLEEALEDYKKAFEVDAQSAIAQQGKSRVARAIVKNRYEHFKNRAEEAEKDNDWDKAVAVYKEAIKAFPEKEEFQAGLEKAREEGRRVKIRDGLIKAYSFERDFEWAKARDAFVAVLDIDDENEEAKEGMLKAGNIVRVLLRYNKFLEDGREYANRGEFQKAIQFFNEAMAIKPSYLALSEDARQLQDFLRDQTNPVSVNFVSDGNTWVSIAGYQMIGKFQQHAARILPGNYRVRGRRKGYRDVLLEVHVRSGKELPPIKVICYQRI